jgi:hypothetical protein
MFFKAIFIKKNRILSAVFPILDQILVSACKTESRSAVKLMQIHNTVFDAPVLPNKSTCCGQAVIEVLNLFTRRV